MRWICLVWWVLSTACAPNYDHDPCEWTGSGFTAKHDCPLTLMCLNSFDCPDGQDVPNYEACSGPRCSVDADCRADHFCYEYSDTQGYCMPLEECATSEDRSIDGSRWARPIRAKSTL